MTRSKLIQLDAESPGTPELDGLSEAERQQRFAQWRQTHLTRRVVRIIDERHEEERVWRTQVEFEARSPGRLHSIPTFHSRPAVRQAAARILDTTHERPSLTPGASSLC